MTDNLRKTTSKIILTHKGVTGTLADLCKHFGVPYRVAYVRLQRKSPLSKVFSKEDLSPRGQSKIYTHNGFTGTLPELAKHFGVPYARAYYRLKNNVPLDEVLSTDNNSFKAQAVKYTYKGVAGTLPELAKHFGVNYNTAYRRLANNLPLSAVFATENKSFRGKAPKYTYDGVTGTLPELAKHFGVNYGTAYGRLERNLPLDKVFSNSRLNSNPSILSYNGVTGDLEYLCNHFKLDYTRAYNRLQFGYPIDIVLSPDKLKNVVIID